MTLTGLHVPMITPFAADGSVAVPALERLAHEVLDAGAAGIVALGTTGEPASLTPDERRTVLETCAGVCRDRSAPLIAGAGTNATASSADDLLALAGRPEIAAALVVVPYYTRPSEAGVVAHFERLAAISPVPIVIYNIPYRTGRPLGFETLLRLAAIPGVTGFKHAVGGIDEDTVRFMAARPEGCSVLCGDDLFLAPLLAMGASGGILASAHLRTSDFAALIAGADPAGSAGGGAGHGSLAHSLARTSAALFEAPNPVGVKAALHAEGRIPTRDVRLPLLAE
ncbi:dihydrodipicolinate synthase family protein [Actinocorallia longicatena]|uniref:4-hydroxy-tetrahydrodipicolinate synthase n=1 Tax=Actinocorallia longicatena TaxID=111803 RepID=A0ABP6QDV3_9ACTN